MTAKRSTEQAVTEALASSPNATPSELAEAAGLGRSTVSKALAKLERDGKVRRTAGGRNAARRLPDRWSLTQAKRRRRPARSASRRLRPGELDGLVLDYLAKHAESGPLTPTAIASGLSRSAGAVGNCLARLAAAGCVRQVSKRPRRYGAA